MNQELPEDPFEGRKRMLSQKSQMFHQALVVNAPVRKIPESTFVNEILPYYSGESTNADLPVLVAAAAGGPFLEFDVVDATGTVLFRAPALLERDMFDFKQFAKGQSAANVFATAQLLSNRSPRQAAAFIQEQLTNRGFSENAAKVYHRLIERRNAILARYGKSVPGGNSTESTNSSGEGKAKPEIDYENSELL